ncbi:MAG: GNAT family N-acetyltransferase [Candidatus Promineifilaceae bacterium]
MNLTIRPFESREDYDALERIERDVWPDDFETAEEHLFADEASKDYFSVRLMAEIDGTPVGWALTRYGYYLHEPNRYTLDGSVLTSYQGQGVGTALYNALGDVWATKDVAAYLVYVREDQVQAVRFVEKRGFENKLREPRSELDLTQFGRAQFEGALQRVADAGITLHSLTELQATDPDWKQKTWALRWPIRRDIPTNEPLTQTSMAQWEKSILQSPAFTPDGYIVAIAPNGEYIGYSHVETAAGDPTKLYTGVTGVKRAWRRKSVATALKGRVADFALAHGATRIEADNEENNPMYELNMRLGFQPLPAWLTFKKAAGEV